MLSLKLERQVQSEFKRNLNTVALDEIERRVLMLQLSKDLRYKIALTMHNRQLMTVKFFQTAEKTFIANICPLLKYKL
jgi:hypothetical protein